MSEYPSDWKLIPIREIITESRINPELDDPSKRISVRLHCEGVEKRSERATDQAGATRYYKRLAGQFIYGKQNLHKGAVGIVPEELDGFCSSQDIPAFDITPSVDPNWFLHLFRQRNFYESLENIATGTGSKRIQPSELGEKEIAVPPLPEQKKIAEILSGIDQQIANQQNKASKWLHLHQGILDLLMTQGTRGRAVVDTDAGKVPDNWKIGRVEDFFALGRGRVISIPYIKDHPGPYPVFSSQSKNNGEMGRMDTYDFDGDYFTWTTDGAYAGSVFARSGRFNCTNVCGTGRAKSPDEADTKFAAYFLQRVAKGHVSYVGNPKLMNNTFAEIPFALPPIDEQSEINEIIDSARRNIDLIESQILSLSNLKKSVSSDLLSGRKRVSV